MKAMSHASHYVRRYWYLLIVLLLIVLFGRKLVFAGTILFMVATALLVSAHRMISPVNLGIELVTLYTVAISIAVSPLYGSILAAILILLTHTIQSNLCGFMFIKCAVYVALCVLAASIAGMGIVAAGIIVTIVRNALFLMITFAMNPSRVVTDLPATTVNIFLNVWLFIQFGTTLLGVF